MISNPMTAKPHGQHFFCAPHHPSNDILSLMVKLVILEPIFRCVSPIHHFQKEEQAWTY